MQQIRSYKDLRVYQAAIEAAMRVFNLTKRFPVEEKFSMVDQMCRSSRSVCANIGEAWRKIQRTSKANLVILRGRLTKPGGVGRPCVAMWIFVKV